MATGNYKQGYEQYKKYYLSLTPAFKKPVNQAYTTIIFSFLAISLFGWYAIRPTMQTIFELKRQIADKTEIDKKMEEKISALIEAQAAYEEIQPSVPVIASALPPVPDPIRAVRQVKILAEESQVTLINVSVPALPLDPPSSPSASPKSSSGVSEYVMTITASGSYPSIKNFLTEILNLRRVMQLESITFAARRESARTATPSAAPSGTQLAVDLKLKVFYFNK